MTKKNTPKARTVEEHDAAYCRSARQSPAPSGGWVILWLLGAWGAAIICGLIYLAVRAFT